MKGHMVAVCGVLIVALLIMFTLSGIAQSNKGKRLIIGQFSDCVTADPHVNNYSYSRALQVGPYEPLLDLTLSEGGTIEIVPWLAERYEISENGTVFTFNLRQGIEFTDGTPFNAEAVKYNLERIMALGYTPADDLECIKDIEKVDEYTVKVTLDTPFVPFIRYMTYPLIVSPTAAKDHEVDGDWGKSWLAIHTVGTGPYLLDEWKKGESWKLVKNDAYWGGWEGKHVDEVLALIIPEESTRMTMLCQGTLDIARVILAPNITKLSTLPETKVYEVRDTSQYMTVQMKVRGYLTDPRVRRAFLYVFPYEAFWTDVVGGHGRATNGPMSNTLFGWNSDLPMLHQDLDKARELLTEAGYPEGFKEPLTLYIISSFYPQHSDLVTLLQANLAELGIQLEIRDIPSAATYLSAILDPDRAQGPDLYMWSHGSRTGSPARYLALFTSFNIPPNGSNGAFYQNPEYDALYKTAVATVDPVERAKLYGEMQKLLVEDPPQITIGETSLSWGLRNNVEGLVSFLGDARIPGGWYYIYKE